MRIDKNRITGFLQFRKEILNIDELEEKYSYKLPPIYRSFITVYEPYFKSAFLKIEDDLIHLLEHILPAQKKDDYTYDDDWLAFERFYEVEEVLQYRGWDGWQEDVLEIAEHGYAGGLVVGIKNENLDKIYFLDSDTNEMNFLANNIHEFFHQIEIVLDNSDYEHLDSGKFYKNWTENFWRIENEGTK